MNWGPFSLDGKVAAVTGAAHGIGRGIARHLAGAGASVLVTDIDEVAAKESAATIDGAVASARIDVAHPDAGRDLVAAAAERLGPIDVLVNNAGIYPQVPMLQMERQLWERILAVNLTGLAFLTRDVAADMVRRGQGGAIVNIGSIDGLHPSMVGLAAYDASKGGVHMLTKSLALELAPHGIRVNEIAPGGVATEGTAKPLEGSGLTPDEMAAMMADFIERKIPLGRMGVPGDIATVAVFLASEASAYMTGETIVVDGGTLLT